MSKTKIIENYHYTACGLNNVYIGEVPVLENDAGSKVFKVGHIKAIHTAVALAVASKPFRLTAHETRFLRKHMRLTQAELGELLHKSRVTVARWENGQIEIDHNAEVVLRLNAIEGVKASGIVDPDSISPPSLKEICEYPSSPEDEAYEIRLKYGKSFEEAVYIPSRRSA